MLIHVTPYSAGTEQNERLEVRFTWSSGNHSIIRCWVGEWDELLAHLAASPGPIEIHGPDPEQVFCRLPRGELDLGVHDYDTCPDCEKP